MACIGVVTTRNIHEGFEDQGIIIEWSEEAIDAFAFKYEAGKAYIIWKPYGLTEGRVTEILGAQFSDDNLRLVGEPFILTDHFKGWREGGDDWRCPGHGTLVTVPDDRYFYHAYSVVLNEWTKFQHSPSYGGFLARKYSAVMTSQGAGYFDPEALDDDDFSIDSSLALREWDVLFLRPTAELKDGKLSLQTSHDGYNFLGFRLAVGNYSLQLSIKPGDNLSGIGIYTNQSKLLSIGVKNGELPVYKVKASVREVLTSQPIGPGKTFIKYTVNDGKYLTPYWSKYGLAWDRISFGNDSAYDTTFLATRGHSPRAGLIAAGLAATQPLFKDVVIENCFRA